MGAFRCVVCFEDRTERLPLPKFATLNGDVLRQGDCNHPVCQACMAAFVTARVEEQQVFGIRCPFLSCRNELYEQDVEQLVQNGALAAEIGTRLSDLRKQDYKARISDLMDETQELTIDDYRMMKQLWASTRRCPRCNVLMEKSQGCNSFGCICGHRFTFTKAPRGYGDGDRDFEAVIGLAIEFQMHLPEARRCVEEGRQKGIKKYQQVLSLAKQREIRVDLAELHVLAGLGHESALAQLRESRAAKKLENKAKALGRQLGTPLHEARQLLEEAYAGDTVAQSLIRVARQGLPSKTSSKEETVDHSLSDVQNLAPIQSFGNATS